jgi:two-component system NtrC family sensor kinase
MSARYVRSVKAAETTFSNSFQRTRKLVEFVKALTRVESVDSLLERARLELKKFPRVKGPVLAFAKSQSELLLYFCQGPKVVEKVVAGVWPQKVKIRINNVDDSQYLANIFGRPFGRLLTIPLQMKRKSSADELKVSAILFFEHSLKKDEWPLFLSFIKDRLQPISIALDRILLEQDLSEAAALWESTFDGLQDPVVILDTSRQVLRANKSFLENFEGSNLETLQADSFRHNERIFEAHRYPIGLSTGGLPVHIICHYADVTQAHRLRQQMIQNEKMAAIGQMAGHIAHELNNPLTGIRSLSQVLIQHTPNGSTLQSDLKEVEYAAARCQTIIKNLIEFSRGDLEHKRVNVSMNEILSRTLPLLKTLVSRFELTLIRASENCVVHVEPQLMQQVIFNIIKNAAQAMGDSGLLTIQTKLVDVNGAPFVELSVTDTGDGISEENQKRIFDFFFTTKSQGQGTGLGLSLSQSIVEHFGGTIDVTSKLGEGSAFAIRLPAVNAGVGP